MGQVVQLNATGAKVVERIESLASATRMRVVPLCDRLLDAELDPKVGDVLAEIRHVVTENMLRIQEQAWLACGRLTAVRDS